MIRPSTRPKQEKGIVLIAAIMLMVFASIAVLGVTAFLIEQQRLVDQKRDSLQLIELAHAGMNGAIFSYRFRSLSGNGYFPLGQFNLAANYYFVLGGSFGDLLMVDTSNAVLDNNNRNLEGLVIQNANNSQAVTIDRMIVSWDNNRHLNRIRINNSNVWNGNMTSPADADISDVTLDNVPNTLNIDHIRFNGSMVGSNVSVRFVMTDGSTRDVDVFPASDTFNFIVNSTGKISGDNKYRTIEAEYNAITERVITYREIDEEFTP